MELARITVAGWAVVTIVVGAASHRLRRRQQDVVAVVFGGFVDAGSSDSGVARHNPRITARC